MSQHRSEASVVSRTSQRLRDRWSTPVGIDVTDIIPIDEFREQFDALAELDDLNDLAELDDLSDLVELDDLGDAEATLEDQTQLLAAPELDDLHTADDLASLPLMAGAGSTSCSGAVRHGQHRRSVSGPARGRILIGAMAVGAVAAAVHTISDTTDNTTTQPVLVAEQAPLHHAADSTAPRGMQVISVKPAATFALHDEEFAKGVAYAQERAEREARLQRPLFVAPTTGIFTSSFGYRWGSLHAGIDIANSIGTPIVAASDGVVIEAGPAGGYGALVKLRHSDGTVTLYGHVNTWTVSVGERVMAGDQIATMGNRGYSTGPHCHFEVLLNGTSRVDPLPWLAQRGINLGNFAG